MTTAKNISDTKYVRFKQYRCRRSAKMFHTINRVLASGLPLKLMMVTIALILRPNIVETGIAGN